MTIEIARAGNAEGDFLAVFPLLLDLHKEGGFAVLDRQKAAAACYRVLSEGMTFVARNESGQAIGTLGLQSVPFWYSATTFLQDQWFFVTPEARGGQAGAGLLRAARDLADATGQILMISVSNPDRRKRRSLAMVEAESAGYVPVGYTIRMR